MSVFASVVAGLVATAVMTLLIYTGPTMGIPKMDMIGMPMMVNVHPRPPEMELGPMTIAGMLVGHLVFGLVVALVYVALI